MPYKEKEIEKLYYTIGEVAEMFNVNTSHIRFWSKQFSEIRPATNKKGNRLYTQGDIENIRKIFHLVKEKGFTIKGAKEHLKNQRKRIFIEHTSEEATTIKENLPTLFDMEPVTDNFENNTALRTSLERIKSELLKVNEELSLLVH